MALGIWPTFAHAAAPDLDEPAVAIHRDGDTYAVEAALVVEATPEEVWDVLTDYDHMAQFVANVLASRILRRDGERLEVEQTSRLAVGPFYLSFNNVRAVELVPHREIRSQVTSGDMNASAFTTRITAEGSLTRISSQGTFLSDRWIPPFIGTALLEAETRKQFREFRTEILRRKSVTAAKDR
jgi:uncharacterized protein YndB with AHSA1/START domain